MPVTVTTRIEEKLLKKIDDVAKRDASDRSTVIRQLLIKSVKERLVADALKEYAEGHLTLWQAAKKAGLSLWEMVEEQTRRHVEVPYSLEDLKEDVKGL